MTIGSQSKWPYLTYYLKIVKIILLLPTFSHDFHMPIQKQPLIERLLHSKLVVIFELILLVGLGLAVGREMIRRHQIQSQIQSLEDQAVALEKQNAELSDLINVISTPNYQEEQARLKLGMQKPGESVVAVLGVDTEKVTSPSAAQEHSNQTTGDARSNPQRWLDYFLNESKS